MENSGLYAEPAVVTLDGELASINTPIEANVQIKIEESTAGTPAEYTIEQLPEYSSTITFMVNGKKVECPKFVQVNGELVSGYYSIKTGDEIQMLKYYTVSQLLEFMDIMLDYGVEIQVNNQPAFRDTIVYENFSIDWEMEKHNSIKLPESEPKETTSLKSDSEIKQLMADAVESPKKETKEVENQEESQTEENIEEENYPDEQVVHEIQVRVNEKLFTLSGKKKYTFIDAFDAYGFDVATGIGKELVMLINGITAQFVSRIKDKDAIEIYWK